MALVRPMMKRDHDGIGGWKFRLQSVVVPPTYINCSNITPGGSFSVALNSAGEAYFGSYKDDVNAAIAAAVSDAVAEIHDKSGKYCQDQCSAMFSTTYDGVSNDASATAQIVLNTGVDTPEQTELCWPHGDPLDRGIHITASAPGVAGVDLRPFISAMGTSYPVDTPSEVAAGLAAVIADLLADPSLIATIDPDTGDIYYDISGNKGISIKQSGDVTIRNLDATGTDPELWFQAVAVAFYDSISFIGDTLVITGRNAETVYRGAPSGAWGSDPADSNFFPDDFSLPNSDGTTPRTIDQTIPLTNTGGAFDVSTPSGDTASLTASGSMSLAVLAAGKKKTEDGYRSRCYYDVTYINVVPMQRLCGPIKFELLTRGAPYKFHHTNPPPCSYNVSPVFTEET